LEKCAAKEREEKSAVIRSAQPSSESRKKKEKKEGTRLLRALISSLRSPRQGAEMRGEKRNDRLRRVAKKGIDPAAYLICAYQTPRRKKQEERKENIAVGVRK